LAPPPALAAGGFDRVMRNPPYLASDASRPSGNRQRALATREAAARLADWLEAALAVLRPKGSLTVIHRSDRLDALLAGLQGTAGRIRIFPLWPAAGKPAKRIVVTARKAVAGPPALTAGLVLHEADGRFTPQAEAVLRAATALDF
jgi:tRNA1(Val) A37 N6-methylase TrmN6